VEVNERGRTTGFEITNLQYLPFNDIIRKVEDIKQSGKSS
jgi:hypothetical protein